MATSTLANYYVFLNNFFYNIFISIKLKRINRIKELEPFLLLYIQGTGETPSRMVRLYMRLLKNKTLFYKSVGGRLAAYAFYIFKPGREAHLHLMVTDEQLRGQGLGKEVLDNSIAALREAGNFISLNVDQDNTAAVNLYQSRGFKVASTFNSGNKTRLYMVLK